MAIILRCPECRVKFKWDFTDKKRWPEACPNPKCKAEMGGDKDDDVICMPSLKGAATSRIDASYRELETSSEARMHMAAADAGCSASDMSALKITNLRDNVQIGETYMPEVRNEVTATMEAAQQRGIQMGFTGQNGAEYGGAVQTGPAPNAGAKMRTSLQQMHAQRSGGYATSDMPALETRQPGYRIRG